MNSSYCSIYGNLQREKIYESENEMDTKKYTENGRYIFHHGAEFLEYIVFLIRDAEELLEIRYRNRNLKYRNVDI